MKPILEYLRRELATREAEAVKLRQAIAALEGFEPREPAANECRPDLEPDEPLAARRRANIVALRAAVLDAIVSGSDTLRRIAQRTGLLDWDVGTALADLITEGRVWQVGVGTGATFVTREPEADEPLTDEDRALLEVPEPPAKAKRATKAKHPTPEPATDDELELVRASVACGGCDVVAAICERSGLALERARVALATLVDKGTLHLTPTPSGLCYAVGDDLDVAGTNDLDDPPAAKRARAPKAAPVDPSALNDAIAAQIAEAGEAGCKSGDIRERHGLTENRQAPASLGRQGSTSARTAGIRRIAIPIAPTSSYNGRGTAVGESGQPLVEPRSPLLAERQVGE